MKRRQLIQNFGIGLLGTIGLGWTAQRAAAQAVNSGAGSLSVEWLGHTCFLFQGGGQRIIVNPFLKIGCTAGYRSPAVAADYVLLSSRQFDEGASEVVLGNPRVFYEPGAYQLTDNSQIQGIRTEHDRLEGKRFGNNTAWRWTQAGLNILHLGGIASEITIRQKILMGAPDVLIIPVGGKQPPNGTSKYDNAWPEVYTAEEAKKTIETLNPRLVIPTHYRTQAADPNTCDLVEVQEFLQKMNTTATRYSDTNTIVLSAATLPTQTPTIQVMGYRL
ncbi:MAG: MBL fold metallo-hydrolase [Prochlorotrichaceae cyanobacterium]|jgi:L-ascorbate metabolism protein UlaG (beta-lactamase superfamily)